MAKQLRLEDLSPDAAQIVLDKRTAGRYRLKRWLKTLHEVELFDQDTGRSQQGGRVWLVVAGVVLFFLVMGTVISILDAAGTATIGAFMFAVFVAFGLLVFLIIRERRLKRSDLADDFHRVLLPFLRTIEEDIPSPGKVSLDLDLSGPTDTKIVRKEKIPPGRFRKVLRTVYDDPWCRLDAPLAEGSRLSLNISNIYTVRDCHWRNSRGKFKRKRKWKKVVVVTAGLVPNARTYAVEPGDMVAATRSVRFKLTQKKNGQMATVRRKYKFKSVDKTPDEYVASDELVGMFFQLGAMLKLSQPGS